MLFNSSSRNWLKEDSKSPLKWNPPRAACLTYRSKTIRAWSFLSMNLSPEGRHALLAKTLLFPSLQYLPHKTPLSLSVSPPPSPPPTSYLLKSHHLWDEGQVGHNLSEDCILHIHNHNQLWTIPLVLQWVLSFDQRQLRIFFFSKWFMCLYTFTKRFWVIWWQRWCPALSVFFVVSSVQSLNRVRLFATPWIAARQASLSIIHT